MDKRRHYAILDGPKREEYGLMSANASRHADQVLWCRKPLYGPCDCEQAKGRCSYHCEYDRVVGRATLPPGPLPPEATPQRVEDPRMPGEPPPGDPRVPRAQGPDPEPADTAPSAAAANSGSPPPQQLSREGPDPRDVAKRTVDRMKSEYMRVLNEIPGNPGGRLRVNAKTGSSVPVTPMTTEASRSIEWAILAAVLTVAEEEVLAAAREGRISFNDEDVERELAEPPEDQGREKVPIFVTKNITKAQSLKAPFDSYDWIN